MSASNHRGRLKIAGGRFLLACYRLLECAFLIGKESSLQARIVLIASEYAEFGIGFSPNILSASVLGCATLINFNLSKETYMHHL